MTGNDSALISTESLQGYFHALLEDALNNQRVEASDETTSYLINMLTSFMHVGMLFESDEQGRHLKPLALLYGEAFQADTPSSQYQILRRLGDTALFVAGIFPGILHRKPVGLDYYIAMGGTAYAHLSLLVTRLSCRQGFTDVYDDLGQRFAIYVDVLGEVTENTSLHNARDILQLYEDWLQTGSERLAGKLRHAGITLQDRNQTRH